MKFWTAVVALAAVGMGCQTQQKPATPAAAPSVLDVTAPPAHQPSVYALPPQAAPPMHAAYAVAAPAPTRLPASGGPAYLPPGQTANVDPTVTPTLTTAPAQPDAASYTVKQGDTLFHIAREQYGDGKKWKQIAAANPGVTPATLKVGQKLLMP